MEKKRKKRERNVALSNKRAYYFIMIVAYLYLIFACLYKYLKNETLESCLLEIILILVLSLVIQYVHVIHQEGEKHHLRGNLSKKESKTERMKCYLLECNFVALFLTSLIYLGIAFGKINVNFYEMQIGNIPMTIILGVIICYLVILLISFGVNYWISEKLVKTAKRK